MSQSVLKVSDDLIENQQFQKKRLTDQIEENTQLKKLCDHLEESCNSEIFTTYRQSNNINENGFNDNQINNSNREGKTTQQEEKVRQIHKFSQSEYLVNNSVITTESFHIQKDKNQTKYKNNLLQNKHQTMSEERQITFNDESVQKSVQSSIRGSYIQKSQKKPEIKYDFSKSLQLKKDLLKLTRIRKKIMTFFNNKTIIGRTNLLKNNQIQSIINDLSDVNDSLNRTNSKRTCLEILQYLGQSKFNFLKHIPPFNPQNSIVFFLNFIFCLLNCLFYLVLSIDIIFDVNITETFIQVGVCLQIVEILIKLNTSVYIHTEYFSDREVIFLKYLKQNLIYDLLPLLSLIIQFYLGGNLNIVLKAISFIKIYNVDKDYKVIYDQICISAQKYYYLVQLIHLILSLFLLAHSIACCYYFVGLIEKHYLNIDTWFSTGFTTDDQVWWKLYLEAINWSLTLMTTGSNVVYTPLQAFFTSFIMLFSTIIFGYFINIIGDILAQKDEAEQNQRKDINVINQYMRKRSINRDLQRVINLDIEYFYQKNYKKEEEQNQSVLDKLSINLKQQLKKEYFGRVLSHFNCLNTNFSEETKQKLALQMQEEYFLPNQIIFNQEKVGFDSLMFVVDGETDEVEILGESSSGTESDAKEIEKESDEQSLVIINQNDHRKSVFDSHIKEEKVTRKSKTIQDVEKNVKYLNVFNENAIKEKSNQFLPRVSVLENLYEISQAEGVTSRTSVRVHKKREQIKLKQDLLNSFQNLNSFTNVEALTIMKHPYENPWLFDKQKDYQYYFPEGNLKMVLTKHNRISRQKYKLLNKAIAHKKQ